MKYWLNVDDDYDTTNVVLHSNNVDTASINNGDKNESVTIPNNSNIDNPIANNKGGSTILKQQKIASFKQLLQLERSCWFLLLNRPIY